MEEGEAQHQEPLQTKDQFRNSLEQKRPLMTTAIDFFDFNLF